MQKITPFLWFDGQAEEAARFYTSVFPNSRIKEVMRPDPKGPAMSVTFELEGLDFIAFNGGPEFSFTPAISLFVSCKDQREVDALWAKLTAGGEEQPCGWLKDKYGLSWQIIPDVLGDLLQDEDPEKAGRAMQAMLGMRKLDIAALQRAHAGK